MPARHRLHPRHWHVEHFTACAFAGLALVPGLAAAAEPPDAAAEVSVRGVFALIAAVLVAALAVILVVLWAIDAREEGAS